MGVPGESSCFLASISVAAGGAEFEKSKER